MKAEIFTRGVLLGLLLLGYSQNTQSQIFKKLKEKVVQSATEKGIIIGKSKDSTKLVKNAPKKDKKNHKEETERVQSTAAVIDYNDALVFKSPNDSFNDITLQSYNGLPRFGTCNFYMRTNSSPLMTPETNAKRNLFKTSYPAFENLLMLNLARDYFEFMDREYLTAELEPNNITEELVKSRASQRIMKSLAFSISTEAVKRQYFCPDNNSSPNCYSGRQWGGYTSDEFTQNEKYAAYIKDHFDVLKSWSENFFKNSSQTVYMVTTSKFNGNNYDFDLNGYWVQIPPRHEDFGLDYSQMHDRFFFEFLPQTDYGNKLLNKVNDVKFINGQVLLKLSPEKAEALVNKKPEKLYLASKTRLVFKGISKASPYTPQPEFTYHFDSPVIEIFEDAALAEKIGEISLENLTFKGE